MPGLDGGQKHRGSEVITKNDIWTDKETAQKALVLRVDDYHVYYQQGVGKEKFIKGVLIWEFLEQFEDQGQ